MGPNELRGTGAGTSRLRERKGWRLRSQQSPGPLLVRSPLMRLPRTVRFPLAIAILSSSCEPVAKMTLLPNSSSERLAFTISEFSGRPKRGYSMNFISVIPCPPAGEDPDSTLGWVVHRPQGVAAPPVGTFTYGVKPEGWIVDRQATPLLPGCYQVYAELSDGRSAGTEVRVDSAGRVQPLTSPR